jgi:hypothetical protein
VLTKARAAVERRCDDEEDRRWLELATRAKKGPRELGSEGERGGEGWGCSGVYIGGRGHRGGVTAGGNGVVMALTRLKMGLG